MNNTKHLTNIRPYPTIEDKIALFKHHGIDAENCYGDFDQQPITQQIMFDGGQDIADLAVAVAKVNRIRIISLSSVQHYMADPLNEPSSEPTWEIMFG